MKKLYFISNLQSGKNAIRAKLASVIDIFTAAGYEVTVRTTQAPKDATAAAEYACLNGTYDLIVCSGGDGTLNEVVQGLMYSGKPLPIGYIPCGSTNDFGRSLRIPTNVEAAAKQIVDSTPFSCDIGVFDNRYFLYVAAFGAFVETVYETSQNAKNVLGHLAYILHAVTLVPSVHALKMKIEANGTVYEGEFLFGMISNTASVGGTLKLKDFRLDDGKFEVVLIRKPAHMIELQGIISQLLSIDEEVDSKYIEYFRASKLHIISNEEIPWTLDGEYGGESCETDIEVRSQAVQFCVKDHSALNLEELKQIYSLEQKEASESIKEE